MIYTKNPVGIMIMNMNRPHDNIMFTHIERSKYAAVSVLDSNHMIKSLPNFGVVYPLTRFYTFEPHAHTEDEGQIKDYAYARYQDVKNIRRDAQTNYIIVQINNEQGFRNDDLIMYYYMMEAASKDPEGPVGMAFGNFAPGNPRTGFWGQDNEWEKPAAQKFLQGFNEFNLNLPGAAIPAFYLGDHEYTTWYPLMAVNGGKHREMIPTNLFELHQKFIEDPENYYIDWSLPQDHLGRNYQGIMKALGAEPINGGREWSPPRMAPPKILLTEMLFDAMGDVQNFYAHEFVPTAFSTEPGPGLLERIGKLFFRKKQVDSYEYALGVGISKEALVKPEPVFNTQNYAPGPRGALSYKQTWMKPNWFGDLKDFDTAHMYQMQWPWQVIYHQTTVLAGTKFAKGWTSDQWLSYQPSPGYEAFQEFYEPIQGVEVSTSKPTEPTDPPVTEGKIVTFIAKTAVNIREIPVIGAPIKGQLRTGVSYNVYENSRTEASNFVWWKLVTEGWVAERSINGETVLLQPKEPLEDRMNELIAELILIRDKLNGTIEKYNI